MTSSRMELRLTTAEVSDLLRDLLVAEDTLLENETGSLRLTQTCLDIANQCSKFLGNED